MGRKLYYESILDKLNQDTAQTRNYLAEAKEMPADADEKIREEEIDKMFKA
jgi:heat shock protein HspQ